MWGRCNKVSPSYFFNEPTFVARRWLSDALDGLSALCFILRQFCLEEVSRSPGNYNWSNDKYLYPWRRLKVSLAGFFSAKKAKEKFTLDAILNCYIYIYIFIIHYRFFLSNYQFLMKIHFSGWTASCIGHTLLLLLFQVRRRSMSLCLDINLKLQQY